jgi:hypothetical protein
MSANAEVLPGSTVGPAQKTALPQVVGLARAKDWNPRDFAREQIRGLVRRVFFAGGERPVRQIVFSAAESHIDIASLCAQVAQALAVETRAHVAIADRGRWIANTGFHAHSPGMATIKSSSIQMAINLWRVPGIGIGEYGSESATGLHWLSDLAALRNEFEYAVIHGPSADTSSEATLLGQLTDGIILVLGAHSTRRATAREIKGKLEAAHCRILGTVLSERTFPVPQRIYRRL